MVRLYAIKNIQDTASIISNRAIWEPLNALKKDVIIRIRYTHQIQFSLHYFEINHQFMMNSTLSYEVHSNQHQTNCIRRRKVAALYGFQWVRLKLGYLLYKEFLVCYKKLSMFLKHSVRYVRGLVCYSSMSVFRFLFLYSGTLDKLRAFRLASIINPSIWPIYTFYWYCLKKMYRLMTPLLSLYAVYFVYLNPAAIDIMNIWVTLFVVEKRWNLKARDKRLHTFFFNGIFSTWKRKYQLKAFSRILVSKATSTQS